jgi:hypothetical protein
VAACVRLTSLVNAAVLRVRSLADGVVLGVLDDGDLAVIDGRYYDGQVDYVDLAYNLSGLMPWEQRFLAVAGNDGGRVVVIGAGGGREVEPLLRSGRRVEAYEPNPRLGAFANTLLASRGFEEVVRPMERHAWPAVEPDAAAVVIGWGALMLVPGRQRRHDLLLAARSWLVPGGHLLVSVAERRSAAGARSVQRISSVVRRARGATPTELGDVLLPNFVHLFTRDELQDELEAAGLDVVELAVADGAADAYLYAVCRRPFTSPAENEEC